MARDMRAAVASPSLKGRFEFRRNWQRFLATLGAERVDAAEASRLELLGAVFDFCRARGFALQRLRACGGGLGCNEFVLQRHP